MRTLTIKALIAQSGLFWSVALGGLLGSSWLAEPAWGHGATATVEQLTTVRITTQYDTGEPISRGQVAVFSPDDAQTPWLTGITDEVGVFEFMPTELSGDWEVVVRKAGHGQSIMVPIGTSAAAPTEPTLSPIQKGLTIAAIVWGFVGTALFFARRSPPTAPSPPTPGLPQPSKEN